MNEKTLKDLLSSLKETGKPKTSAYDTTATVTRIENGVAWVHIPGGVRETPVKLTINAKVGDNVQVRVSGGRAFMVGNASAPPTDDHTAKQALAETRTVSKVVKAVKEIAEKASKIAGNTNQYFWHTESGTDTGAHITEIPQEEFLADPANGGGNLLARSNGIAVRNGLTELATFGSSGSTVGKTNTAHMEQTPTKTTWYGSDGTTEVLSLQTSVGGNSVLRLSGNRIINATTETTTNDNVTTYSDNIEIRTYPVSGHDHGEILLAAYGANATAATVRISDHEVSGTTVLISPSKIDLYTDVHIGNVGGSHLSLYVTGSTTTSGELTAGTTITANAVKSYTPTYNEAAVTANCSCTVSAGVCSFIYRGANVAHSTSTVLCTLPAGAQPTKDLHIGFVKNSGVAIGTVTIGTDGRVIVATISSSTATGRIYFNCTYPVV